MLPADWRDGLARLATMPPPPSLARRWERIVADALMLGRLRIVDNDTGGRPSTVCTVNPRAMVR